MTKHKTFGVVFLATLGCCPAWSQQPATLSERFLDQPPRAAPQPAAKPQAARRQPRVADVPVPPQNTATPTASPEALEDEALQRKISGICRGC